MKNAFEFNLFERFAELLADMRVIRAPRGGLSQRKLWSELVMEGQNLHLGGITATEGMSIDRSRHYHQLLFTSQQA